MPHKISIIGTGSMGMNHLRMAQQHPDFNLIGLYDTNPLVGQKQAQQYGINYFQSIEKTIAESDACVIATPTSSHALIAEKCLLNNTHCLVEKPVTHSYEEAIHLQSLSASDRLMVGYVERYNPVVYELKELIKSHPKYYPKGASITRLSYNQDRSIDIGVVLDLMSHDIDLMTYIFGGFFSLQHASNSHYNDHQCENYSHAVFTGDTQEMIVDITASRITQTKQRMLWISCEEVFITANLLHKTLLISSNDNLLSHDVGGYRYIHSSSVDEIHVRAIEPLWAEYNDFSLLISGRKKAESNLVSASQTLQLCHQVISQ